MPILRCWQRTTPRLPSLKVQTKRGQYVNRVSYDQYGIFLDGLPTHERLTNGVGPFAESETREYAKARQQGPS